jgi:Prokaryotic E2 family E
MEKGKEHKEVNITILINQVPHHLHTTTITAAEIKQLAGADNDYEVWQVVKSPDPEGQLPVDDIQVKGTIELKSGDKFRVVPPGTFGAVAEMPQQLSTEITRLRSVGHEVEVHEASGLLLLVLMAYPLPHGYNKATTQLLLKIPLSYPNGKLDMFWTDYDLRLQESTGQAATSLETLLGRQWLRFSWHPQKWCPGVDNIFTFLEFVNRRLMQLR